MFLTGPAKDSAKPLSKTLSGPSASSSPDSDSVAPDAALTVAGAGVWPRTSDGSIAIEQQTCNALASIRMKFMAARRVCLSLIAVRPVLRGLQSVHAHICWWQATRAPACLRLQLSCLSSPGLLLVMFKCVLSVEPRGIQSCSHIPRAQCATCNSARLMGDQRDQFEAQSSLEIMPCFAGPPVRSQKTCDGFSWRKKNKT